jgi:hypothetical protein
MNMEVFIRRPNIDLYGGIRVTKDTEMEYKNENVQQTLKNLVLHSVTKVTGEGYESTYDTTIHLNEGDVLVFEAEGRGYIKPVEPMVSIQEAIDDLENIKDVGVE